MSRKILEQALQQAKEEDKEPECNNYQDLELVYTLESLDHDSVYCLQYSPDGKKLFVGYDDGGIEVITLQKNEAKISNVARKRRSDDLPVLCIRNHPTEDGTFFAASSKGVIFHCSVKTEYSQEILREKGNEINTFDFSSDGSEFVTGGKDLCVRLYDTDTCKLVQSWEGYNLQSTTQDEYSHAKKIFCVKYMTHHQDQSELRDTFVTGGWDNHIKVWDSRLKDAAVRKIIAGPHICGDSIDISGYRILTGSWTQKESLLIHDLRFNKQLGEPLPFNVSGGQEGEYLYCARFYDQDTVVAGGSGTGSVQAISVSQHKVIGELKLCEDADHPVMALDTDPDSTRLSFAGRGNQIHMATLAV